MEAGQLRSTSLPQLKSADHSPINCWDPYMLTKERLSSALLDDQRLHELKEQLGHTLGAVPDAARWTTEIERCGLTPTNLSEILQVVFGFMEVHQIREPTASGKTPYILMMASFLLDRADILEAQQTVSRQAMAVARIVGYALMRVCQVAEDLTYSQVSMIGIFSTYYANVKRSVTI